LEEQIAALSDQYQQTATKLTQIRQKAAKKLSALISAKMQQLNMAQATFALNFSPNKNGGFSASGMEQVEFLVATNPGHAPQPLTKVASGGELSRISLAIQVITAGQYTTPTLIFDEVDVGIGGKTAAIVGQLLSDLSTKTQILCVTHLPQVAAHGTHHLQVSKQNTKQSTHAKITSLNGNNRIEEIARMLGGLKITAQTLAHAKEMCENTKNRLN
ncbi:MAG: DNA repair protein RecN, partial [Gammaproteobacteria bacterium]|nr:DNA repair protein RecN [Gammaproteobacteria bacterium]